MTTIACNKDELWGDRQFTNSANGNKWKGKTKVYKFKAHEDVYHCDFIVGFCGGASDIVPVVSYFSTPELWPKPPRPPRNLTGLVLTAEKDIFVFEDYTKWLAVNEKFHSVGSGSTYALGAMAGGASPKEAVQIASKLDAYTGLGTKGFSFV